MKIDAALVTHVASLANLELTLDEVRHYEVQLGKIIKHIELINEMPDPLGKDFRSDTLGDSTPSRPDVVVPSLSPEAALAAAPLKVGSAFQVPRIIE